jgi:competence protein ComEC
VVLRAALPALVGVVAVLALGRPGPSTPRARAAWLALVAVAGLAAGALAGVARLQGIDAGALRATPGTRASITGYLLAPPRRAHGEVSLQLATPRGRLMVRAPEPVPDLPLGTGLRARGTFLEADPWREAWLRRIGIASVLEAGTVEVSGDRRGGLRGRVDAIRARAEASLARGMPTPEERLADGFVLGGDDRIDPRTVDDFKRSGLAHLLAVSGQNVVLICLLAWPLLAVLGLTLRARRLALLALIGLYVLVTGAGPSIQRAGVMGAAGVLAGLAGRPGSRWYALLLAADVTLALNPRASGDVGWQLSFAATAGIMLWSSRLTSLLAGRARRASFRRALAEGVAVTLAATVATTPLMAHHFDGFSAAALPANLLALPAVAPAMWLGMLAGFAGQLPSIPVEPLNWVNSLLLAYIAEVAHWFGAPAWSRLDLGLGSPAAVIGAYLALLGLAELGLRGAERRAGLGPGVRGPRLRSLTAPMLALALAAAAALTLGGGSGAEPAGDRSLRVEVLDVGQGDAILLEPPAEPPVLVDAGPADAAVAEQLRDRHLDRLAALVITHDQSDHAGGAIDVLDTLQVDRLAYARLGRSLPAAALADRTGLLRLSEGSELRDGALRLEVLWPPAELLRGPVGDPNQAALVLLAEWRGFSILLTADAEAEAVPIDPGAVDVLKVAHHGSEDSGLGALLDRTAPKLAVISVGAGNPYGHPSAQALGELRAHSVPTLRTDESGTIAIEVGSGGFSVAP